MALFPRLPSRDSIDCSVVQRGHASTWRRPIETRTFGLICSLVLPAAATLAALRFLIPSQMDAGSRGVFAVLARAEDIHPLLLAVALFLLLSAVAKHWLRYFRARLGTVPPASPTEAPHDALASREPLRLAVWIAASVAVAFVACARLFEISRVASPSMVPTLNVGDRLIVNRLAYGLRVSSKRVLRPSLPRRGDLIVFANPERDAEGREPASVVKRVIGLPGDQVAFVDGSPVVNGWVVPSCDVGPFLTPAGTSLVRGHLAVEVLGDRGYLTLRAPLDAGRFARFEVPPGQLFVLGDDRPASRDSRAWNGGRGGGVRIDTVEGRVSRLAAAVGSDGRLDLRHPFASLRPELRATHADVSRLERRIADCVAHPPRSPWPPPPEAAPRSSMARTP
jgi:signal peptidase I